jgi:hypothetical protein
VKYIGQTGRTFRVRYKKHVNAIRTNKQNSKFAQHILETQHNYDPTDQSMQVLHIEKKSPKLNKLERFYIYDLAKRGLQMNDTFADIHNPIFHAIIKKDTQVTPPPNHYPHQTPPNPHQHTTYSINTRNNSNIRQDEWYHSINTTSRPRYSSGG